MTIIVFLIDTSASMNQRTFIGARPTLLDIAKGAVESFVKLRQRNPESRFDRYMLFTSEELPNNIKAGWKENLATFMNELKNIKATGLSVVGLAIKNIFDVLNINRMQSGIDTYGSGRSPFFLEPSVIICITDGGKLSSPQGVQDDIFPLPKSNPIPGADLTSEIFRWDQRLFGLVLRLTGTPTPETMGLVPSDNSPLDKLCEQTGGRSYAVRTHRMFQQCIESLVQKVQSGVVINFEKIGPDPPPIASDGKDVNECADVDKENQQVNTDSQFNQMMSANSSGGLLGAATPPSGWTGNATNGSLPSTYSAPQPTAPANSNTFQGASNSWHNCRKMIYVPRPTHRGSHGCFWPIPESYWPDSTLPSLPARTAHPNLKFTCTSQEPMVIDNLPFDKYELEPSPLTQYILSRKQPTVCWQVFIANSSKHSDVGHPFGYLKASTTKPCVNLFVMPYNYPVLLPLLDDLFKTHRLKPAKEWRQQFENYLRTMPPYYASPLKRALERMGVSNIFPDKFDSSLSYLVMNHLKKLKNQAKVEYERICGEVEKRVNQNMTISSSSSNCSTASITRSNLHEGIKVKSRKHISRHLTSNHLLQEKMSHLRDQVSEFKNFTITVKDTEIQPQMYRNPFDILRSQLIDQLTRMRANFLQQSFSNLLTDRGHDQLHCKPISQMGNYQDYLKKMNPPLREIESAPVRQHMFGNPFKIDKRMSMMVDEADVDLMGAGGGQTSGAARGTKRPIVDPLLGTALRPNKRKKGPIPPDFSLQRLVTPPSTPPPSPLCSMDERGDLTPPHSPLPHPHYSVLPPSPLPHLPEGASSPHLRQDPGSPISSLPGLTPSPSVITPGYLHQVSPPGSPAAPYPREDIPPYPGVSPMHPVLNGDMELSSVYHNELKIEEESESSEEENEEEEKESPETISHSYSAERENPLSSAHTPPPYAPDERNGTLNDVDHVPPAPVRSISDPDDEEPAEHPVATDTIQTVQANKNLLLLCYKEVKKPGREFGDLYDKLKNLQGSTESKVRFLKDVIQEALRFKRHSLAKLLTQTVEDVVNGLTIPGGNQMSIQYPNNGARGIVLNGHNR